MRRRKYWIRLLFPLLFNSLKHSKLRTISTIWPNMSVDKIFTKSWGISDYCQPKTVSFMELSLFLFLSTSMTIKSLVEISNLKISWLTQKAISNSSILLLPKLSELKIIRWVKLLPSLVLLITWHLISFLEKDTIILLTCGLLEFVSMNFFVESCLLEMLLKDHMISLKKLCRVNWDFQSLSMTRRQKNWSNNFWIITLTIDMVDHLRVLRLILGSKTSTGMTCWWEMTKSWSHPIFLMLVYEMWKRWPQVQTPHSWAR